MQKISQNTKNTGRSVKFFLLESTKGKWSLAGDLSAIRFELQLAEESLACDIG